MLFHALETGLPLEVLASLEILRASSTELLKQELHTMQEPDDVGLRDNYMWPIASLIGQITPLGAALILSTQYHPWGAIPADATLLILSIILSFDGNATTLWTHVRLCAP